MSDQNQRLNSERPAEEPTAASSRSRSSKPSVDLDALTAAVERLLRHDLAVMRERLRGGKRKIR